MNHLHRITTVGVAIAWFATATVLQAGEEVSYSLGDTTLNGYIAQPAGDGRHPGVIVVHEWWGNNEYPRKRADMLAELGYVAMALDMYGEGKIADHPDDAGKFAGEVRKNMDVGEQRFRAALDLLSARTDVDPEKIAAIGYCFGGGVVLEMARRNLPLKAVASFHGSIGGLSPVGPTGMQAKVLVLNGADDPFVKPEQIASFKKEMDAAGADYRFIDYPGAVHGFTNPSATENGEKFGLPLAYNEQIDQASWLEMQQLFDSVFQ